MLSPDAQMLPVVPVIPHPRAEMGRREKSLIVGRDGFPAKVEDSGDSGGGDLRTSSRSLESLLTELIAEVRELKEFVQENMH